MATRASESFFWLAANNTCGERPWCPTRVIRPDGCVALEAPPGRPAVLTCTIDLAANAALYNPIGAQALRVARGEHPWLA